MSRELRRKFETGRLTADEMQSLLYSALAVADAAQAHRFAKEGAKAATYEALCWALDDLEAV